ncbi:hypothetical protein L0128_17335 [candidate division KSB1 bacterium]|nr:hypothetical protein [candidate division KSB1 bacterium]
MAISYSIRADVIDINSDAPGQADKLLVDSNVWYWMTYSQASYGMDSWRQPLILIYPGYVNNALTAGAKLFYCGLALAELAHLIEKTEHQIFNAALNLKEFRHNYPQARAKVVAEVQAGWAQVRSIAKSISFKLNQRTSDSALQRFQQASVDGYDLFLLEVMFQQNTLCILTDDGDFATVAGIQVFTANRNVLAAASAQGKLRVR